MNHIEVCSEKCIAVWSNESFCVCRRVVVWPCIQMTVWDNLYNLNMPLVLYHMTTYCEVKRYVCVPLHPNASPVRRLIAIQVVEGAVPQHKWVLITTEANKLANPLTGSLLACFATLV